MDVLEEARQNLQEKGVEVELPEITQFHENMNTQSEVFSSFGLEEGLEAASHDPLNNRLDVYSPLAINRVIHQLDEDQEEQTVEALQSNRDKFSRELNSIESSQGNHSFADSVKLSKIQYLAALEDESVDEDLKQKIKDSVETGILHDTEHELVHASHYQRILDGDVDSLQDDFQRYVEDVKNLNDELVSFDEREINEGVTELKELEVSAAMKFLDEDSLSNIISLAGKEEQRWNKQVTEILQKYAKRSKRVKQEFYDSIGDEAESMFKDVSKDLVRSLSSGLNMSGGSGVEDAEELVNRMEEEGVEEYETIIEDGCDKSSLVGVLSTLSELDERSNEEAEEYQRNALRTKEYLENAIIREAEIQGDFEGFIDQYADRMGQVNQIPDDFTEAYAQFWTGFREGNLEDGRDAIFDRLQNYDIDGLEDTVEDLLTMYDEVEGSQEERVAEVMSSQFDYLEENYDIEI